MTKFKVGDLVRRTIGSNRGVHPGDVVVVGSVGVTGNWIGLERDGAVMKSHLHDALKFELVKPKTVPMILSEEPQERKDTPITSGVLDYFPRALAAVAKCSKAGNDQHNPGQPLHWDKSKSTDHADCIARHLIDRHSIDTDGIPHMSKLAWRALALLETELEKAETNAS